MTDAELQALAVLAREEVAMLEGGVACVNAAVAKYGECPFDPAQPLRDERPACRRLHEELVERGLVRP